MFSVAFQLPLPGKVDCCKTLRSIIRWYKDMFPHWFPSYKQLLIVVDGALSQGGGACKQDFSGAISPYIRSIEKSFMLLI